MDAGIRLDRQVSAWTAPATSTKGAASLLPPRRIPLKAIPWAVSRCQLTKRFLCHLLKDNATLKFQCLYIQYGLMPLKIYFWFLFFLPGYSFSISTFTFAQRTMLSDRLLTLTRHFIAPPPISTSSSTSSFPSTLDSSSSPFPDVELDDLSHLLNTPRGEEQDEDTESCASSNLSDSEPSSRRSSISSFASSLFFATSSLPLATRKPAKRKSLPSPIREPEPVKSKQIFGSGMTNVRYVQAHRQVCRAYW